MVSSLPVAAAVDRIGSVALLMFVQNPVPSFPRQRQALFAVCPEVVETFREIGSGGQDRTADLGVMNHHLGKNLSLCLLYGCSHQEFSDISHPFLFFAFRHTSSAAFFWTQFGHKKVG